MFAHIEHRPRYHTRNRCLICATKRSVFHLDQLQHNIDFRLLDDAMVICQMCRHGGHASHLMDWFFGENTKSRGICPVADCDCKCAEEF